MNSWRHLACFPIVLYRWTLSPLKRFFMGPGAGCRFHPTCSAYAMESIMQHGVWSGSLLALKRLTKCHPWGPSGWDPVPSSMDPDVVAKPLKPCHPSFTAQKQTSGDLKDLFTHPWIVNP